MGMYTELILGCALKEDTPTDIINKIGHDLKDRFQRTSYYFGVSSSKSRFYYDKVGKNYIIDLRCNTKYVSDIIDFLSFLKPYIEQGSGSSDMYAIVTYEEAEPDLYFLDRSKVTL